MKFVDLSGLPVTWNKIGILPNVGTNQNLGRPFVCIVNGNFSIFWPLGLGSNPMNTKGAVLYSYDGLGNMCTYQTSDFSITGNQNGVCRPFQIWQNNNTFVYALLGGGTWKFQVPNVFTPGATYILNPTLFPTPSPCGTGTYSHSIFCGRQGVYCNEFVQAFPESDNYWASIYDSMGNFLGGGYIGNSANDLFDQRQNTLPPAVSALNVYDRNGIVAFGNFNAVGTDQQVVGSSVSWLFGDPRSLVCGSGSNTVFVSQTNPTQIYYTRDFGMPGFSSSPDNVLMGITDMHAALLYPDFQNKLLTQDFYIQLPAYSTPHPVGYLASKKQIYQVDSQGNNWSGNVYAATLDLTPYGPKPISTRSDFSGLANYHRAVSPNGTFQA